MMGLVGVFRNSKMLTIGWVDGSVNLKCLQMLIVEQKGGWN